MGTQIVALGQKYRFEVVPMDAEETGVGTLMLPVVAFDHREAWMSVLTYAERIGVEPREIRLID